MLQTTNKIVTTPRLTDVGNIIPTEYFDHIEISLTPEVETYRSGLMPKNQILNTFKRLDKLPFSNVNIKFSDNIWDFTKLLNLPISKDKLSFSFNPKSAFCEIEKLYVLNEILKKTTKLRVLKEKYSIISKALDYFEENGYVEFSKIPKTLIIRYYDGIEKTCSYNTVCAYKGRLLLFLEFYERTFEEIADKSIKKYLQDRNTAKLNSIKAANKTPEVPVDYFPIFIEGVKSVMRNETEDPEDRITAACIILYSQIGFRTSELFTVKTNCVHSVYSPDKNKPLYYMDFTSFKHGHGENGGTNAHTYMNELSLEAYNILLNLCSKARQKLNSDCLMVGKLQKNKAMTSQIFNERYRKFCLRHWRDLQNLNIGDDYEDLNSFEVSKFIFMGSDGYMTYDPNSDWAKDLKSTDRIYFPEIRQFRVSVCTSLYRQQIPLHYIRKHMNHLSEDMAAYYIRPQKNIEKEYSETIYRAVFKDGSKMLGQNADAFVQKISDFIAANNYNIQDNTEEVITAIANKFPLRSKVGGMCIRCGEVIPCASNNPTDSIYCAFGMCQNHCHMFFMADISYDEYLRHKDVLEFNEKKGFKKAYQKELHKMQYIVENSLLPELNMLGEEIEKHGAEEILEKYPQLTYIIKHYSEIKEEVSKWTK